MHGMTRPVRLNAAIFSHSAARPTGPALPAFHTRECRGAENLTYDASAVPRMLLIELVNDSTGSGHRMTLSAAQPTPRPFRAHSRNSHPSIGRRQ